MTKHSTKKTVAFKGSHEIIWAVKVSSRIQLKERLVPEYSLCFENILNTGKRSIVLECYYW